MVREIQRLLSDPDALAAVSSGASRIISEWLDNGRNTEDFLRGLSEQTV
jgi:hypothetical protein